MRTPGFRYAGIGRRGFLGGMALMGVSKLLRPFARPLPVIDPAITVSPTTAFPGDTVTVTGSGFDPRVKFALSTVDRDGTEVGITSNTNRPAKNGTFHVGIRVPPLMPCLVQAYQSNVMVACAAVQVKR